MSKTHAHQPSKPHGFKFEIEQRFNPEFGNEKGYVTIIVEKERKFELGPWFKNFAAAAELADKAERGDQFCNAIPCVNYETSIPRPEGSWWRPEEYGGRDVTVK